MIKKYWKEIILIGIILISITWATIRESVINQQSRIIGQLELSNSVLSIDRDKINYQLKDLQSRYRVIELDNIAKKKDLEQKQKELSDLIAKHKADIDALINIPTDTIFVRLQARFPNYDNTPAKFPFSASQIRPIYSTAISYYMVKQEYSLQSDNLKSCLDLNNGYELGIKNLNSQISNLQSTVINCDTQINNYKREVAIYKRQVKNKSFWNKVLTVAGGLIGGYAILK
jgi:hypothetical protein